MRRQVLEHITLYEAMAKAKLPWKAIGYGEKGKILQVCKKIEEGNLQDIVPQLQQEPLRYLCTDIGFWDYMTRLVQEGAALGAIKAMLLSTGDELLSNYAYTRVKNAIEEEISDSWRFAYLKYYDGYSLEKHQKESLMAGLEFISRYTDIRMEELDEEERKLLWEPVFSGNKLKDVVSTKENLRQLLTPGILPLLKDLEENAPFGFHYGQVQWEQLLKDPVGLRRDYKAVTGQIQKEDVPHFFIHWMENEALWFDLKKLKSLLGQMSEEELHQMAQSRTGYINALYGSLMAGVPLGSLPEIKEKLLIYAITQRKKHFLSLVQAHFPDFQALSRRSLLFDPDVYWQYININEINEKELEKCFSLSCMDKEAKALMTAPPYLFKELELLSGSEKEYIRLFHQLQYQRSDDRIRVFREVLKKKWLPGSMEEAEIQELGGLLSQKALSQWMQAEFKHIQGLRPEEAVGLLTQWQKVKRFVPEIERSVQVRFLLRNTDNLEEFQSFSQLQQQILERDPHWKKLQQEYELTDEFISKNEESIKEFLYENGAEIMYTFLRQRPEKREEIRRILMAELMGRFYEVKYFKDDLEREIDYPVSETAKKIWQENESATGNGIRLWEEDRLLPVMQIGEVPTYTCLSYRSGAYNECLLSCFDSNKKVMQASVGGKISFRAILRLTKGSFQKSGAGSSVSDIQFADLTGHQIPKENKQKEELVLFIERPYFSGISKDQERKVVTALFRMLRDKAGKLQARLVISESYRSYVTEKEGFVMAAYSLYISASKNGSQYMDSIGGKATLSNARSYGSSRFWMESEEKHAVEVA